MMTHGEMFMSSSLSAVLSSAPLGMLACADDVSCTTPAHSSDPRAPCHVVTAAAVSPPPPAAAGPPPGGPGQRGSSQGRSSGGGRGGGGGGGPTSANHLLNFQPYSGAGRVGSVGAGSGEGSKGHTGRVGHVGAGARGLFYLPCHSSPCLGSKWRPKAGQRAANDGRPLG